MTRLNIVFIVCAATIVTFAAGAPSEPNAITCMIYCPYGFRVNADGQSMCACKKSPCDGEEAPLNGYFCGRGVNRRQCPSTHQCKVAPNDAYAVCCPRAQQTSKLSISPVKKGSCPVPPSDMMGICIARCTNDSDCPGAQKCCGGCPRQCTKPVLA
ncbi:unnamed protein product [Adineta ricciae]|uniref:WAP domain-containing protein n=1 Tax=Adineta ricciae TaxID=249248 RepID=A0A814M3L5_ADIRI|nr:unnamed protein product [Adineta ricciae]CAF1315232.1 unnamed protein product [Adineta ricciae]